MISALNSFKTNYEREGFVEVKRCGGLILDSVRVNW